MSKKNPQKTPNAKTKAKKKDESSESDDSSEFDISDRCVWHEGYPFHIPGTQTARKSTGAACVNYNRSKRKFVGSIYGVNLYECGSKDCQASQRMRALGSLSSVELPETPRPSTSRCNLPLAASSNETTAAAASISPETQAQRASEPNSSLSKLPFPPPFKLPTPAQIASVQPQRPRLGKMMARKSTTPWEPSRRPQSKRSKTISTRGRGASSSRNRAPSTSSSSSSSDDSGNFSVSVKLEPGTSSSSTRDDEASPSPPTGSARRVKKDNEQNVDKKPFVNKKPKKEKDD